MIGTRPPPLPKLSASRLGGLFESTQLEVLDRAEAADGTVLEVLQFRELQGAADVRTAEHLFHANQSGMRLKMVRIRLRDSHVRAEPGSLYYMQGDLQIQASTGGGFLKGLARKMVAGETFFVNEIHGSGDVYLEPTFGHFILHRVEASEGAVIADKGLFYAGTAGLDISAARQKTMSAALFGGDGVFQTRIAGTGVALLYSPVPQEELHVIELNGDKLSVDGNFALMRSEGVTFRTEKSSKTWLSTAGSGEGLLQTYEGTGRVWIAPTHGIYRRLSSPDGLRILARPPGSHHTEAETKPR